MRNNPIRVSLLAALFVACALSTPAAHAVKPKKSCDSTPSPKRCYQTYLRSLYYAKDLNDVSPYWAPRKAGLWNALTNDGKTKKLDYLKATSYVGAYKFVSQKVDGDNAHLVITGINIDSNHRRQPTKIEADMVKDNGYWKIADAKTTYTTRRNVVASK